jgi:hypothetical protein
MNARINRDLQYKKQFLISVLLVHGGVVAQGGGKSEAFLYEITKDILYRVSNSKKFFICVKWFSCHHVKNILYKWKQTSNKWWGVGLGLTTVHCKNVSVL